MTVTTSAPKSQRARTATANSITDDLSRAIHEHRLAPSTKLGENDLSEIYGVSRAIVRTALQSLAHHQIVEIQRNRGAFVAQPTSTEAHEVFEARELLEPRTAHAAALKAQQSDITLLTSHILQEHTALDAGDRGRALYLSGQFHLEIARIADNKTITDMVKVLVARSSLIIALYWQRESAICESKAHHALIEAIAKGDAGRSQELMQSHLVDLHSALNLHKMPAAVNNLKQILMG